MRLIHSADWQIGKAFRPLGVGCCWAVTIRTAAKASGIALRSSAYRGMSIHTLRPWWPVAEATPFSCRHLFAVRPIGGWISRRRRKSRYVSDARGSIINFRRESDASNSIDPARPSRAGLEHPALGDWRLTMWVGPPIWHSGTPEPDRVRRQENGTALLADIAGTGALRPGRALDEGESEDCLRARAFLNNCGGLHRLGLAFRGCNVRGSKRARLIADRPFMAASSQSGSASQWRSGRE